MQTILNELTNGTISFTNIDEEGQATYIQRPPTAFQLRTKRLIEQLCLERDGVIRANKTLETQLGEALLLLELEKKTTEGLQTEAVELQVTIDQQRDIINSMNKESQVLVLDADNLLKENDKLKEEIEILKESFTQSQQLRVDVNKETDNA